INKYRLFKIYINELLDLGFIRQPGTRDPHGQPNKRVIWTRLDDLSLATYFLQTISNILRYLPEFGLAMLAKEKLMSSDDQTEKFLRKCTSYRNLQSTCAPF